LPESAAPAQLSAPATPEEPPLFQAWSEPVPPPTRHPNFADVLLLGVLPWLLPRRHPALPLRPLLSSVGHLHHPEGAQRRPLHHRQHGRSLPGHLGLALLIFPLLWQQGLFAGLHWNARAADRRFRTLLGAAVVCFLLAMADEALLPGPANAPIDKLLTPAPRRGSCFAFGVTFAPFFEESIFRGFLLPALCTAFDWSVEKAAGLHPMPLDPEGHPQWSLGAMVFASITTSIPFAYMHAEQTATRSAPLCCWLP